jgi:hypothetical protein
MSIDNIPTEISAAEFEQAAAIFEKIVFARERLMECVTLDGKKAWRREVDRLTAERRRVLGMND